MSGCVNIFIFPNTKLHFPTDEKQFHHSDHQVEHWNLFLNTNLIFILLRGEANVARETLGINHFHVWWQNRYSTIVKRKREISEVLSFQRNIIFVVFNVYNGLCFRVAGMRRQKQEIAKSGRRTGENNAKTNQRIRFAIF